MSGTVQLYKKLEVTKKARLAVKYAFEVTKGLPAEHRFGLASQIHRASVSIGANIAEGYGRGRTRERANFLRIARGSAYELEFLMDVVEDLFPHCEAICVTRDLANEVSRMLSAMIRKAEEKADA